MNLWSFTSLLNVDISALWIFRIIWIPILAINALYWLRKPNMDGRDLNLAIITFYMLFLLSYGWVTEQSFVDILPFIFIQILLYQPNKTYMYILLGVQTLVFVFSTFNQGPFAFEPLLKAFSYNLLPLIQVFDTKNPLIWTIRGVAGLLVSISLCVFLIVLVKPAVFQKSLRQRH